MVERNNIQNAELCLVSDAFFPFSDSIEVAHEYGVKYISQPGGSIRDSEVESKCNELGIKMFLHKQKSLYSLIKIKKLKLILFILFTFLYLLIVLIVLIVSFTYEY